MKQKLVMGSVPSLLGESPGPDICLPATGLGIAGMIKRVRGEAGCNG